jgi:hypothetical protein
MGKDAFSVASGPVTWSSDKSPDSDFANPTVGTLENHSLFFGNLMRTPRAGGAGGGSDLKDEIDVDDLRQDGFVYFPYVYHSTNESEKEIAKMFIEGFNDYTDNNYTKEELDVLFFLIRHQLRLFTRVFWSCLNKYNKNFKKEGLYKLLQKKSPKVWGKIEYGYNWLDKNLISTGPLEGVESLTTLDFPFKEEYFTFSENHEASIYFSTILYKLFLKNQNAYYYFLDAACNYAPHRAKIRALPRGRQSQETPLQTQEDNTHSCVSAGGGETYFVKCPGMPFGLKGDAVEMSDGEEDPSTKREREEAHAEEAVEAVEEKKIRTEQTPPVPPLVLVPAPPPPPGTSTGGKHKTRKMLTNKKRKSKTKRNKQKTSKKRTKKQQKTC